MLRPSYAIVTLFILSSTIFIFFPEMSRPSIFTHKYWKAQPSDWRTGHSRLARFLQGNERRYQKFVKERYEMMDIVRNRHPNDTYQFLPAFPEPFTEVYTLWDFFVPVFSCPFPVYRVGTLGDGGKYVCGLERAMSRDECVVYSMGVEFQSSFEETILSQFPNCQVFGFDFSVPSWGPQLLNNETLLQRAHFNQYKISGIDNHEANPKEYSMQGIMNEKGHTFVDILKMDIEGAEFKTLAALIASFEGQPLPFGQLQVEIHFGSSGYKTIPEFAEWWKILEDAGLRAFWTEPNRKIYLSCLPAFINLH
ncbi:methyltransferase domain-containing protein [Flagelloscypha sp. PMI_526]|nr:methyltransferase domain-containing protein [Flagelloscypha sp. PMI_526]